MADEEGLTRSGERPTLLRRVGKTVATATDFTVPRSRQMRAAALTVGGGTGVLAAGGGLAALAIHDPAPFAAVGNVLGSGYGIGAGAALAAAAAGTTIIPWFGDNEGEPMSNNPVRAARLRRVSAGTGLAAAVAAAGTGLAIAAGATGVLPHDGTLIQVAGEITSVLTGVTAGCRIGSGAWNRVREMSVDSDSRARGFRPAAEMRSQPPARTDTTLTER